MDQLVVAAAVEGHALLIDCHSLERRAVKISDEVAIYAVHCGEERRLMGSSYADRRADCAASGDPASERAATAISDARMCLFMNSSE